MRFHFLTYTIAATILSALPPDLRLRGLERKRVCAKRHKLCRPLKRTLRVTWRARCRRIRTPTGVLWRASDCRSEWLSDSVALLVGGWTKNMAGRPGEW